VPPLKNNIDIAAVTRLAEALAAPAVRSADVIFDADAFVLSATAGLDALELKARIAHVAGALVEHLRGPFAATAQCVREAAEAGLLDTWSGWPCTDWVTRCGLGAPDVALPTLAAITPHASAEFAIRPYIDRHPERTRAELDRWVDDPSEHLRRLASEGTRPLLPWAPRVALLAAEPAWAVPVLDRLREDPSGYVRRSVANHLNDLARVDRDLAVGIADRWQAAGGCHVATVLRHGLRGLVKRGDVDALRLIGVDVQVAVQVVAFEVLTPTVELGDALRFRVVLRSGAPAPIRVVVDHIVHHVGADGSRRPKVFKTVARELAPGVEVELVKAHPMRPITTRTYRPGRHLLEIQVNGRVLAGAEFDLAC
jgi:3-methyladenine DNA glycosylase AlkC